MDQLAVLKLLHVLFIFTWIGGLLALTRLMGYHAKQSAETQLILGKIYRRMYLFVDFPSMIISIILGIALFIQKEMSWKAGWFHMKLLFSLLLIACDIYTGRQTLLLAKKIIKSSVKYKILHGLTALFLIGVLVSIYIFKARAALVSS